MKNAIGILLFVPELLLVSLFPGDLNLEITIEGLLYAPIYIVIYIFKVMTGRTNNGPQAIDPKLQLNTL